MCGIAGWFGPEGYWDAERMRDSLRQRGPDSAGIWRSEKATLVHTRLAILDLSEAGKQPMMYEGKLKTERLKAEIVGDNDPQLPTLNHQPSSVLVFNGEIYNYRELRAELEAEGEVFTSGSDTEVLLRLLVREGEACLPKLAGMFAFAYWDEVAGTALLARDPLGIKPLYYREESGCFSFASESRILRKDGDPTDAGALRDFFLWGSVPEPATLNAAIRQLPAGHSLKWKDGNGAVEKWHEASGMAFADSLAPRAGGGKLGRCVNRSLPDCVALTREALVESMRRHLVSDVPVGIFLSGGIDSTVLLALARNILGREADIRTFSIGFDDPEYDESSIARRTADHFGSQHTEWKLTPAEGAAEIPAFLEAMDQPGIDGFNTWCVSKLARREGMKVVLSGLGGDELFAGYGSFERVPRYRRWHQRLGPLRSSAGKLLESMSAGSPYRRLGSFLRGEGEWLEAYHVQRGIFTPEEAGRLAAHFAGATPDPDWKVPDLPNDPRDIVSKLEIDRYMRHQLLRDSDVYSMAHGLELRVPLVDIRLLETVSAIPAAIRLRQGKQLLVEAVPEIPGWVKNQPKRGFRFPFESWMEKGFSEILNEAKRESPVTLKAWYRTWAVASASRVLKKNH